jgi:hypothetical protein
LNPDAGRLPRDPSFDKEEKDYVPPRIVDAADDWTPPTGVTFLAGDSRACVQCAVQKCASSASDCYIDSEEAPQCRIDGGGEPDCCVDLRLCESRCTRAWPSDAVAFRGCLTECQTKFPHGYSQFLAALSCMSTSCPGCSPLPSAPNDQDHDGVPDSIDTCPSVYNPEQAPVQFTFVPPAVTITKCTSANIGSATAASACGATVTNDAPVKFPIGTTVVTWKATDPAGRVATATQLVTAILGDDTSCCPTGTNLIVGTNGADTLIGTDGSDCILGLGGNDKINGRGGDDFLSGGSGNDTITAGPGNDMVWGGPGIDNIDGSEGDDFIDGSDSTDVCAGAAGINRILNCRTISGCTDPCCETNTCHP